MFVLPPPPRYPTQAAYNAALAGGHVAPMIETNNILSTPSGPEYQFLVGEGLYVLKEDLHLATPPPHPSEAPITNPNPLSTAPQPATAGTKASLLSLDTRSGPPVFTKSGSTTSLPSSGGDPRFSSQELNESGNENSTDAGISSDGRGNSTELAQSAPAFGQGNISLAKPQTKSGRRRQPGNNITKSNSSFISRVIVHETLTKRLQERASDGLFAFANINRAFQWLDLSSPNKADYLTKILFTKAHCLCHDVNKVTRSTSHIDVIMGFSTGEVIWWEPISQRYLRLNKNGIANKTPISEIRWIPGSENLFMAAHMDGTLVVYDKEKEDAAFSVEDEETINGKENGESGAAAGVSGEKPRVNFNFRTQLQVVKSVTSKNQKTNPVSIWKLSNQRINAFAFSPDNRHLAVVQENGELRIIDYLKEQLLNIFRSYYGGLISVCWSPDGKYVLTGGQDDLVSIWYPAEALLVARCQGHKSWVTSVAFDPWRCDDKNYRFGSVAEDCRLCLWDFNVGMLHRPKATPSIHQPPLQRAETQNTSSTRVRSQSTASSQGAELSLLQSVQPQAATAQLPPVCSIKIDKDPLCWLEFTEDAIMTSCKSGHIRTWSRPTDAVAQVADNLESLST
ncbi:hypothetical protein MCOR21_003076 [Pyricularia oryzae]|nr:hypothetical protein MCOR21_003076 [Pyricularia oryzae]